MWSRDQSPPSHGNFSTPSHRWGILDWQCWIPCTRLSSWPEDLGSWRTRAPPCGNQLSSSITWGMSMAGWGGVTLTAEYLCKRTSPTVVKNPFCSQTKVRRIPTERIPIRRKSVFIDIWTNYLRKSKQLNYTAQPNANYCQFRLCL